MTGAASATLLRAIRTGLCGSTRYGSSRPPLHLRPRLEARRFLPAPAHLLASGTHAQASTDSIFQGSATDPTALDDWLAAHKPSANAQPGWYRVIVPTKESGVGDSMRVRLEGAGLVEKLVRECSRIKAEAPVYPSKSKGIKSQKELRELQYAKFNADVRELTQETGVTAGKWMLLYPKELVDANWEKVARALASENGALAKDETPCAVAKVSSTEGPRGQYLICVYCDDSWNKEKVGKLLRVLVEDIGLVPGNYKTDVNTHLGIGTDHVSKIKSSLWSKNDFMTKCEITAARSKAKEAEREMLVSAKELPAEGGIGPLSDPHDAKPGTEGN